MQAALLTGPGFCARVALAFVRYSLGGGGDDATELAPACLGLSIRVTAAVASGSGTERTAAMSSILPCSGGKQCS